MNDTLLLIAVLAGLCGGISFFIGVFAGVYITLKHFGEKLVNHW